MALLTLRDTYIACIRNAQTKGCFPKLYDKTYLDYKSKFLSQNIVTIIAEQVFFWENNLQDNLEIKQKIMAHCASSIEQGKGIPELFEDKNGDIYVSDLFAHIIGEDTLNELMETVNTNLLAIKREEVP